MGPRTDSRVKIEINPLVFVRSNVPSSSSSLFMIFVSVMIDDQRRLTIKGRQIHLGIILAIVPCKVVICNSDGVAG